MGRRFSTTTWSAWGEPSPGLSLRRRPPDQQHDTRSVEHKQDPWVRAELGLLRLDPPQQAAALAGLDEQMWRYSHCCQAMLQLTPNVVQDGNLTRRWKTAATPEHRLVETAILDQERQGQRDQRYPQTTPRHLRNQICRQ
jgi:hypothetical protein